MPSRSRLTYVRALAIGLGAGVMTLFALRLVAGMVVDLAVGAVHPEWLSSRDSAPGWFDGLVAVLGILGLSLSCYVGWRTGRTALRSGQGPGDKGANYLANLGILAAGTAVLLIAVLGFHTPLTVSFLVIMGPAIVAVVVGALISGMRARPTPPTRRDWLNMSAVALVVVAVLGLCAVGVLTGHVTLTIVAFCLLAAVVSVGGVVAIAVRARRETQDSDHTQ